MRKVKPIFHTQPVWEEYKICASKALHSGDERAVFTEEEFTYKTMLRTVLETVQRYITACYFIRADPTAHLSSFFSNTTRWTVYSADEIFSAEEVWKLSEDADYFFPRDGRNWKNGIVTCRIMKKMGQGPRKRIFFAPNDECWPKSEGVEGVKFVTGL